MPTSLREITGVFLRERFRREDFVIAEVRQTDGQEIPGTNGRALISVKGSADADEMKPGLEYRFYGRVEQHEKYGPSFAFKTFILSEPHERGGVIRYLQLAPGVGQVTAQALWAKFKSQAVRVLRETPDVAASAVGTRFSIEKAAEASVELRRLAALEATTIDLMGLLEGRGFPKATAKGAIQTWGNRAAKMLEHNPYLLMAFRGCGFLRTDAMYLDLGHPPGRLKRQALCAWHSLASNTQGHTWFPVGTIEEGLREKIGGTAINPVGACLLARRAKMLASKRDSAGGLWFAEGRKARQEAYAAEKIAAAMTEHHEWPAVEGTDADDGLPSLHQAAEYAKATAGGAIGILGGSPGTGKTYTVAHAIKVALRTYGSAGVLVCAPFGKAAVRLAELMQAHGIDLPARTIHSTLGVESVDGNNWVFRHNEVNPLAVRLIVVDETGTLGTGLAASLIAARPRGCKLLLSGDINQLPPVEHGAVLRDMIAAGVPHGELREIHRNAGSIVRVCAAIRDGLPWFPDEQIDLAADPPRNLKLLSGDGKRGVETIVNTLRKIRERGLADPVWDCQVIVAVNKRSPLSRHDVNRVLQAELNPNPPIDGTPFRLNDKVICLKPSLLLSAGRSQSVVSPETDAMYNVRLNSVLPSFPAHTDEPEKHLVCNGEQGRVIKADSKQVVVQFTGPDRLVRVHGQRRPEGKGVKGKGGGSAGENDAGSFHDLDLAYGITCHKALGSEWKVGIVALDEYPGARMICSREWLLTGLSRAKQVCFLVGKLGTAYGMCRRTALDKRKTFLRELIQEATKP